MHGNGTAKELMSTFSPLDPTKRDESKVMELTIMVRVSESCYLTIRPVALLGYGSIAHERKPNGPLSRGDP